MSKPELVEIADTLFKEAKPGLKPKQLLKIARQAHPKASKKQIVRAAFYGLIARADAQGDVANQVHDFAMTMRNDTTE